MDIKRAQPPDQVDTSIHPRKNKESNEMNLAAVVDSSLVNDDNNDGHATHLDHENMDCDNCTYYGWPCASCAEFRYKGLYGPGFMNEDQVLLFDPATMDDETRDNMTQYLQALYRVTNVDTNNNIVTMVLNDADACDEDYSFYEVCLFVPTESMQIVIDGFIREGGSLVSMVDEFHSVVECEKDETV